MGILNETFEYENDPEWIVTEKYLKYKFQLLLIKNAGKGQVVKSQ